MPSIDALCSALYDLPPDLQTVHCQPRIPAMGFMAFSGKTMPRFSIPYQKSIGQLPLANIATVCLALQRSKRPKEATPPTISPALLAVTYRAFT